MPDKKLTVLVAIIIVLNLGHDFDHIVRGDFRWQLTAKYIPAYAIIVAKYAILGFGLYFYLKNKVGPLFWAIVAGISVALGWLAHFSPFTVQTPQFIYRAYKTPAVGTLAVSLLVLLMLALIVTTTYAQYLWARGSK
jgi:amino acid transporter